MFDKNKVKGGEKEMNKQICILSFFLSFFLSVAGLVGTAKAQEVSTIFSEKLNIYGYGLFDFCIASEGEFFPGLPVECRKGGSFAKALFAPFLEFNITKRARVLTEIEFKYAPEFEIFGEVSGANGGTTEGSLETDTKGNDSVKIEGFGEIDLAYAFFEYEFTDILKIRAGRYLNPFGLILERRDAAPSYPYLFRPLLYEKVGKIRIMPTYNVGIQLRGEIPYFGYVVHVANGRGSVANVIDANPDKAVGVHLFGRVPSGVLEGSLLGFDFYTDKDFDNVRHTTLGGHSILSISEIGPGKIQLWGEVAHYTKDKQKALSWYALLSYLWHISDDWSLLPYVMYDTLDPDLDKKDDTIGNIVFGVNVSPFSQLVLKLEFRNLVQGKEKAKQIFGFGIAYAF